MRHLLSKSKKVNNEGSALVTVIIVVMFISIVATTLLYICANNFFMKVNEAKTRQSFYDTEESMEIIRAAIEEDVAKASEEAYLTVLLNYANYDAATRYSVYEDTFATKLSEIWNARVTDGGYGNVQVMLQNMLGVSATVTTGDGTVDDAAKPVLYIKDINVKYKNADDYTGIISTDFVITPPEIDLSIDKSKLGLEPGETMSTARNEVEVKKYVNYINWTKK